MKRIGMLFLGLFLGAAITAPLAAPKSFRVGVDHAPSVRAATATGGTLTVTRQSMGVNPDNSVNVGLGYFNAGGNQVVQRYLHVPAASGLDITDQYGNVVFAGGTWSSYASCVSAFTSCTDTSIGSAATAGKLNL